ncbi:MAG: hypothetical protein LQ337_006504 [Flavoplaca oasis]|nr:MAG: hypothetical protein LQ337_006504 [Flavoplaca oasis]
MVMETKHDGSDGNGDVIEDTQWNEDEAAMEDLSFITFGDLVESHTEASVDVARIHWSNNCQNAHCDDSKMQLEAANHLNHSDGSPLFLG